MSWFRSKKTTPAALPAEKKSYLQEVDPKSPNHRGLAAFQSALAKLPGLYAASVGTTTAAIDTAMPAMKAGFGNHGDAVLNDALLGWFIESTFIGYPLCSFMSQNWLIDKACAMPGRDAVRHGFEVTFSGVDDKGKQADLQDAVKKANKDYKLFQNLQEFHRMGRIFGIRVAMFDIDVTDRDTFYENPFNPDALTPNTKYRGIIQIDQNWLAPVFKQEAISNPADAAFYEPEWWQVNGKKIHKSHLIVFIPSPVPDLLKPMYRYGGVSVPQRIFERVYAAERTANEAPQLAMSKRMVHWQTNLADAIANPEKFASLMVAMQEYRDNFAVKISDTDDTISQFDTSLADLDSVIMTQYQLVAAIANVPGTKLLGTAPKGFNATGEFEMKSYHEELETIQTNDMQPLVERHLLILARTQLAKDVGIDASKLDASIDWSPVDSPSAKDYAEINKLRAETDNVLVMTGAIDGEDVRARLSSDPNSEYTDLPEIEADDTENDKETDATTTSPDTDPDDVDVSQERIEPAGFRSA